MNHPLRSALVVLIAAALSPPADAADWARFRGPNGSGVSTDQEPTPTTWSGDENVVWKADLPGAGVSCPIVVGDRVFVTCYSGYGLDRENPGDIEDLKRHLVCFDRWSGEQRWIETIDAAQPEDPYTGIGVPNHGYASHTPVSDGERVYAFFGKSGVAAFDLEGNRLWKQSVGVGSDPWAWGSASSLVLWRDKVIVTAAAESGAIIAMDRDTGNELWKQEAGTLNGMWGTPILVEIDSERTDLVMSVPGEVWGMNPDTGKLRWYCVASQSEQAHASAVAADGVVYAVTGRGGASTAVRAGGKGDVTDSHVVWSGNETSRFGTPVVYDDRLYLIANGVLRIIDTETGEVIKQERLRAGDGGGGGGRGRGGRGGGFGSLDYPSPIVAGDKLYYLNGKGETFVYTVGDKPELLAVNRLTDEGEFFGATPAVSDGHLFIRSDKRLYCVGE